MSTLTLRQRLLLGKDSVAVWGSGYLGYSTAAFYARKGVSSILIDIDEVKVNVINQGQPPYRELASWIGFDVKPVSHLITATTDWTKALKSPVHFISVNTERNEEPWTDALQDVCCKIALSKLPEKPLIILESTIAPGWTDKYVKPICKDFPFAVAPRRDWFTVAGSSVETLDRVVGASDPETLEKAVEVLSIVSMKVHRASSYRVVELVKAVENAYRHVEIGIAEELTRAFPSMDVREVLKLAGTKWNMPTIFPSIGIGGYCIPICPKYIIQAAEKPEALTIFGDSLSSDKWMPSVISSSLHAKGIKNVAILGLAYKGNLKVHVASPSLRLAKALKDKDILVSVNDPLYNRLEIELLCDFNVIDSPYELNDFGCVIVACDHDHYKALDKQKLLSNLKDCKLILDCFEIWRDLKPDFQRIGIEYHVTGDAGWLTESNK